VTKGQQATGAMAFNANSKWLAVEANDSMSSAIHVFDIPSGRLVKTFDPASVPVVTAAQSDVQHPRIFYRRDIDLKPLVIFGNVG
jgi:hypothetical protein